MGKAQTILNALCGLAAIFLGAIMVHQGLGFATLLAAAGLCCLACSALAYQPER